MQEVHSAGDTLSIGYTQKGLHSAGDILRRDTLRGVTLSRGTLSRGVHSAEGTLSRGTLIKRHNEQEAY